MPTERNIALIEIVTAANLAGVEAAQKSFLGLKASTLGLAAVLFGVVEVGKAALDNYKQHEEAVNSLTQAYTTQKDTLAAHKQEIEDWLSTNARYIDNQYETEAALAGLIRAGIGTKNALALMNDALDLAAAKHISVADASHVLLLASEGNARGLRDLGFTSQELKAIIAATGATEADVTKLTKEATRADETLASAKRALKLEEDTLSGKRKLSAHDLDLLKIKQEAVTKAEQADTVAHQELTAAQKSTQDSNARAGAIHDVVSPKVKNARDVTDQLTQSQKRLNKDWQDFTSSIAPGLTYSLNQVFTALDTGVQILELANEGMVKLGNNAGAVQSLMTQIAEILPGAQVILQLYGIATKSANTIGAANTKGTAGPSTSAAATYGQRQRGFIATGPFGKGGQ